MSSPSVRVARVVYNGLVSFWWFTAGVLSLAVAVIWMMGKIVFEGIGRDLEK